MEKSGYKDFIIQKELGRGSFGVVYLVQQRISKRYYVLKRINIGHIHMKFQQAALREVEILKKINHPNIIKYYFSYIEDNTLSIITEYAEGGDLYQLLQRHRIKRTNIPEPEIWRIMLELSSALSYLHTNSIIHRDIKCQNVFLTKNLTIKLGDLGASKFMTAEMQATRVGTPLYLAPEMVKQQPYDHKIDVWGLGCILYTLTSKESPFIGPNLITLGISIINKNPKNIPAWYSNKLNEIIMSMLQKNPDDRPNSVELDKSLKTDSRIMNKYSHQAASFAKTLKNDDEMVVRKFAKMARPRAMEPALVQDVPAKPFFGKDHTRLLRVSSAEASCSKYSTFFDSKARISCNFFNKETSIEGIVMEKEVNYFRSSKQSINYKDSKEMHPRPETACPAKSLSTKRPVTARPSLRTIIKSNTTIKLNNFIQPNKGSKLKITVNDLLNHKSS